MTEQYVVICRTDSVADQPGPYVLATRQVFASREAADHYARVIARSREPIVIEGHWDQLRSPK